MHDIKAIRDNPGAYDAAWARKGLGPQTPLILDLDARLRAAVTQKQEAEAARNQASKQIGVAKARKDETEAHRLMTEVVAAKDRIDAQSAVEADLTAQLLGMTGVLASLPNLPASDVPDGVDERANVEVKRWSGTDGARPAPSRNDIKDHVALGEGMGLMDFAGAARMSGARFVALKGGLARMERALAAFMIDLHTEAFGYTEISPPLLVRDDAAFGTNQLPKFREDLFHTDDGFWLIPTAEVALTNLVREQILDDAVLPIRMTADTPCFRSEAGAAGKDTRGMIRMHQFRKVELVSIVRPEDSDAEHERMTSCAEEVLKRLGLAFRRVLLCAGDMGFGARKTFDLEVWLPSQNKYREISSCSNCGDFQARRMNARYRGGAGVRFVHTLNGSALAIGRTLVAIMENYQNTDGAVTVPAALRPYMGGAERVG